MSFEIILVLESFRIDLVKHFESKNIYHNNSKIYFLV